MFEDSGLAVVGQLGSGGDMLIWLLLTMFLSWYLGIWVWDDFRSRCWFLGLSWSKCVLFLGFNFLSEFSESVLADCCLLFWYARLVCSWEMFAGVVG